MPGTRTHNTPSHTTQDEGTATLEYQLAEVTKDFNESLTMWSSRLQSGDLTPRGFQGSAHGSFCSTPGAAKSRPVAPLSIDDSDFLPDSPQLGQAGGYAYPGQQEGTSDRDFFPDSPGNVGFQSRLAAEL